MIYSEEFSGFLKQINVSPTSAERSMDIGSGTLTKALKNEYLSKSLEKKIIEHFPGFFGDYAEKSKVTFFGNPFKRDPLAEEPRPKTINVLSNHKGVPIYNTDFTAGDIAQFGDEPEKVIGHIDLNGFRKCIAFVYIKGSSMYPAFVAGDLIGIEPISDFEIIEFGQQYGIITTNGQRMVKIIRKGETSDMVILKSVNPEYDPIDLPKNKISKLFKVHGPVRDQWQ